ncbi:EAL domain-containing protein [Vibrio harveyi]|uniref:EAL domain-containing protein n=1 Tax=Vibrio harveyi TaxID=669 RepID=UPI0003A85CDD|nr:EAL domain-containing protein [Vibrio harveyi]MBY7702937.1 EAL domain-containing protein [Vibrio harveyi]PNM53498.1 hypothetical protein AL540_015145 [Vibrio harveyi]UIL57279.1 EAL domain-containing protein [Vibrio harveyi]SQA39828.1 diguanylate cyclase [Vibrio harveyi]
MIIGNTKEISEIEIKKRIELDLKLAQHEFYILFQPISWLGSINKPWGFEALVRWSNPFNIGPSVFIPITEKEPMLRRKLTRLVTRLVIDNIRLFIRKETQVTYFTMNVSFDDLNDSNYVDELKSMLCEAPYIAHRLFLEVTETKKIIMTDAFMKSITTLKNLGVRFALDDLGSGFADQDALKLPIWSIVKIDRSQVCEIGSSDSSLDSLTDLLDNCFSLTPYVVIEGVELARQHFTLKWSLNNDVLVQGFYYAKPMSSSIILARYY